jgi:hypothetical protein
VRGAISDGRPYRDNYRETGFEEIGNASYIPRTIFPPTGLLARNYFRVARDSAGTQTRQTGIVSCDRLVSTTIYPIRGLPITSCTRQALAVH